MAYDVRVAQIRNHTNSYYVHLSEQANLQYLLDYIDTQSDTIIDLQRQLNTAHYDVKELQDDYLQMTTERDSIRAELEQMKSDLDAERRYEY
jgi:nitrogen fixation/metabolism regulation signal transduction histidine kinase